MWTSRGYRKRRKRLEGRGDARYLTFSCYRNQAFLRSARACEWLGEAVDQARARYAFDLWAWVFMPDHVHLLLRPKAGTTVTNILRAIKEPVSKRAAGWVRRNAPQFLPRMIESRPGREARVRFWQPGGGYDRNIHSAAEIGEKIAYIHANPLRAKLVERLADWKWSSWRAWEYGVDDPLRIDRSGLPLLNE